MAEYSSFLEQRNGTGEPGGAFPHRERWLERANAAAVRYGGEVPVDTLARHPRDVGDPCLRALMAFVKINAGEAYGVEAVGRARHSRPLTDAPLDRVERLLLQEEQYHTRILAGAANQFGLSPPASAYRAPLATRVLIGTLVHAPEAFFHPVLLAAEVGGLFLFNWLLQQVARRFTGELRESLEARLIEIMIDEIGHVAFNRVAVGPLGIEVGRVLAPEVAHSTAGMLPELKSLGWSRDTLRQFDGFSLKSLPEAARRSAFFV